MGKFWRIILCVSALMLVANPIFAQHWSLIGKFSNGSLYGTCGYFWDAKSGIVAYTSADDNTPPSNPTMFKTNDGGKSWTQCVLPPQTLNHGFLTSIYMYDRKNGWFTLFDYDSPPGVYATTDSGNTWFPVQGSQEWGDVRQLRGGQMIYSGGGIGFVNDSVCMVSGSGEIPDSAYAYDHDYLTTDAGNSWIDLGVKPADFWGIAYLASCHSFFAYSGGFDIGTAALHSYYSSDTGKTWNSGGAAEPLGGYSADIEAAGNALYIQSNSDVDNTGMYRSTDFGKSWNSIGGPPNEDATRFCVPPTCNGGTVIAFGHDGGVWETTDGGDGALPEADYPTFAASSIPTVRACSESIGLVKIVSNACPNGLALQSVTLGGDTIHFSIDSLPALPISFGGQTRDSFYVHFNPTDQAGKFTASLHIIGKNVMADTTLPLDTTIQIVAYSTPVGPQLIDTTSPINFGTFSTCLTGGDTATTFTNTGCAPDTITATNISGAGFTDSLDSLPIIVPKDSSVTLHIHFQPPGQGAFQGNVSLSVTSMGLSENPVISLTGQGVQGEGILDVLSTSLQAGSISFCGGDTTVSDAIHNLGCDTLVITNVRFSGDTTFSLASQPTDSLLAPHDSTFFQFHFVPRLKGAHTAQITFHSRNIHGGDPGHDTTITISGIGVGGTSELSVDQTPRNFGSLYICQSKDTTITLYNKGCDTLRVDSASISNGAYTLDTTYPMLILPDSSAFVKIRLTPDTGSLNGTITFSCNANTGVGTATVQLQAKLLHPASLRIVLGPSDSAFDGEIVTGYVILEGSIPADLISALHFDISHNDDLLTFVSASGVGLTETGSTGTPPLHFILSPVMGGTSSSDTIGTLTFKVYLTDSSSTSLTLSNISFTTSSADIPPDCIASIGDTGASFTYLYRCGDSILLAAMNGATEFSIINIQPNPASSSIEINLSKSSSASIEYSLYDALGRTALSGLDVRSTSLQLDVSSIPSGIYFLRLSENSFVESRQIVIER